MVKSKVAKVVCHLCGQEISKSNYSKHLRRHDNHPESFDTPKYRLDHDGLICKFCGKECKNRNSLCNHERLCSVNPNKQDTYFLKLNHMPGHTAWNKGLTAETDERVAKYANTHKKRVKEGLITSHSIPSPNAYCSRYKYGTYKGFYCDSSWELAFIMYCIDHKLEVKRNFSEWFSYTASDGTIKRFYPDFKIGSVFYEIKGGYDMEADNKKKAFPVTQSLIWISNKEIKFYLNYAKATYGDNFITLYDSSLPSWLSRSK